MTTTSHSVCGICNSYTQHSLFFPYRSFFFFFLSEPGLNLLSLWTPLSTLHIHTVLKSIRSSLFLLGMGFITDLSTVAMLSLVTSCHLMSPIQSILKGATTLRFLKFCLYSTSPWFGTEGPFKASAQSTFAIFSLTTT